MSRTVAPEAGARRRPWMSLRWGIPLALAIGGGLVALIGAAVALRSAARTAEEHAEQRLEQRLNELQPTIEHLFRLGDPEAVREEVAALGGDPTVQLALLLDEHGRVIAATRLALIGRDARDVRPELLEGPAPNRARGRLGATVTAVPGRPTVVGYAPIRLPGGPHDARPSRVGLLVIERDLSLPLALARYTTGREVLLQVGLIVLFAGLLWLLFHRVLTRRVDALVAATRRLAAGHLDTRTGVTGPDELGRVARAVDEMAEALESGARETTAARDALERSEALARLTFDAALDPMIVIDEAGDIQTFNGAAEHLFGWAASEAIGRNVRDLMPSPYHEEHDEYLASYLCTGVPRIIGRRRELVGRRRDGTEVPVDLAVTDATLGDRRLFIGVLRDLTEQKAAEERERQLRRQATQRERLADIGAVTARIAHDFGNPTAGISMTAKLLGRRIARAPDEPARSLLQLVDTLIATAERLEGFVRSFKDFAREHRLELRQIDVAALLGDLDTLWRTEAAERGIVLRVEPGSEVAHITADLDKLRRVLENLMRNALEAIDRGPGTVRVQACRVDGDRVRFVVADDGPGVPTDKDPFALFETSKPTGTGLGLAIARQIVLAHGGDLTLERGVERGAEFHVDLPIAGPSP